MNDNGGLRLRKAKASPAEALAKAGARNPEPGQGFLKPPVWTWEIPLYFFIGGAAGVSAAIALVASIAGAEPSTIRAARWIAAAGAAVSPLLLISDLGRPSRFLYMLRVFKPRSAMSLGAWTLVVFSGATFGALGVASFTTAEGAWWLVLLAFDLTAAVSGLVLATYTGVLLGATVIPVWAAHHRLLPIEFGLSSLGAAVALVEIAGGYSGALNRAGLAAAAIETAFVVWQRTGGRSPVTVRIGLANIVAGPVALALRLTGLVFLPVRVAAGLCAVASSAILRFGWIAAGRSSAGRVSETEDAEARNVRQNPH